MDAPAYCLTRVPAPGAHAVPKNAGTSFEAAGLETGFHCMPVWGIEYPALLLTPSGPAYLDTGGYEKFKQVEPCASDQNFGCQDNLLSCNMQHVSHARTTPGRVPTSTLPTPAHPCHTHAHTDAVAVRRCRAVSCARRSTGACSSAPTPSRAATPSASCATPSTAPSANTCTTR